MSNPNYDIDYALWEAYLADCKANNVTPTVRDYMIFLQEADYDRSENWEVVNDEA